MFGISGAQTLYNNVGHIPTSHQLQWHKAGLLKDCNSITPKLVINVNSFSGTDDQKVAAALTAARDHVRGPNGNDGTEGMAIIYFPEDTYLLFDTIELDYPDSNIVFQGDGSDKTILDGTNTAKLCFGSPPWHRGEKNSCSVFIIMRKQSCHSNNAVQVQLGEKCAGMASNMQKSKRWAPSPADRNC